MPTVGQAQITTPYRVHIAGRSVLTIRKWTMFGKISLFTLNIKHYSMYTYINDHMICHKKKFPPFISKQEKAENRNHFVGNIFLLFSLCVC